jgi:hypothetical protein
MCSNSFESFAVSVVAMCHPRATAMPMSIQSAAHNGDHWC